MANSDKNILITPNTGQPSEPEITFVGFGNSAINLKVKDDSHGNVSFESSGSNLFQVDGNGTNRNFSISAQNGSPKFQSTKEKITIGSESGEVVVCGSGIKLPIFRTAALPKGEEGALVYDSDEDCAKYFNGQKWVPFAFARSGMSPETAGISAVQIKKDYPWSQDGYYWIKTNIGPQRLFCYMNSSVFGGGWMCVNPAIAPLETWALTTAQWHHESNGAKFDERISHILRVNVVETGCGGGSFYQLRSPSEVGLNYTETFMLMHRWTTIGQCSSITNGTSYGFFEPGPFTGVYTDYSMCTWDNSHFAQACCSNGITTTQKLLWVLRSSPASNSSLRYGVACAGGSGIHHHAWFIR